MLIWSYISKSASYIIDSDSPVMPHTVANHKMGHLRKNGAPLEQEKHFGWFKMLGMGTIELGMCHKKIRILEILFTML